MQVLVVLDEGKTLEQEKEALTALAQRLDCDVVVLDGDMIVAEYSLTDERGVPIIIHPSGRTQEDKA